MKNRRNLFVIVCMAFVLIFTAFSAQASPKRVDTDGEGGEKPMCLILGGYQGDCSNNGKVSELRMYGCTYDFEGNKHYATLGASFHGGVARFVTHLPAWHYETFTNRTIHNKSFEWDDNGNIYGNVVTATILRQPGWPHTWLQRTWIRCCDCDEPGMRESHMSHEQYAVKN